MNEERIGQVGTPTGMFEAPNSPFVIDFLGGVSLFDGELEVGSRVQVLVTRARIYGDGFAGIVDVEVARRPDVSYLGALAG